jgi:hypothetical protein
VQEETALPAEPDDSAEFVAEMPTREPLAASGEAPEEGRAVLVVRVLLAESSAPLAGVQVGFGRVSDPVLQLERFQEWIQELERDMEPFRPLHGTNETDERGIVEFGIPAGRSFVVQTFCDDAALEDAKLTMQGLAADERREVTLEVGQGRVVFVGRVVERETEEPVAGAEVELLERSGEDVLGSTRTDGIGAFSFRLGAFERQLLRIEAPGFGVAFGELDEGHERPGSEAVFRLRRSATLFGRIIRADGTSCPGSTAIVRAKRGPLRQPAVVAMPMFGDDDDVLWSTTADAAGSYRLEGLPAAVRLATFASTEDSALGSDSTEIVLDAGEEHELTYVLDEMPVVDGVVIDEQQRPVPGLELWLLRRPWDGDNGRSVVFFDADEKPERELVSDEAGRFRIDTILRGGWLLGPAPGESQTGFSLFSANKRSKEEHEFPALGQRVMITAGHQELTLVVHRGLSIEGRVTDAEGRPQSDAIIECRSEELGRGPGALSGDDGSFCTDPLPPGAFALTVFGEHSDSEVRARAGERDVVLVLEDRPTGTVEGVLLGYQGGSEVSIRAWPIARPHWMIGIGPDSSGEFEFPGLEVGLYDFTVQSWDERFGRVSGVEVRAGVEPTSVRIELRPAARLLVRYEGEEPVAGIEILQDGDLVAWSIALEGASESIVVPAGELEVRLFPGIQLMDLADWGDTYLVRSVTTAAGSESELVFP